MAKWGEGDPRWLVEERPDATNVNNWHWTEKNASQWSKDKLRDLLLGLKVISDRVECSVTDITKCEGEATVNNRKAKLIFFYEWVITLKWKGTLNDSSEEVTGTLEILNLSEEHDLKDVDLSITVDKMGSEAEVVKEFMRIKGGESVKQKLEDYLKCLKEEFSKGLILPTKNSENCDAEVKHNDLQERVKQLSVKTNTKSRSLIEVSEIQSTEIFKCRADEFYRVLMTKELVQAFTQGECVMEPQVGGRFELYGGNVHGHFVELIPNKLIKQKWRFKMWPEGHFSDVRIEINEVIDSTEVSIYQSGIPKTELDNTREGWKRYYWESIKRIFGFGATLF